MINWSDKSVHATTESILVKLEKIKLEVADKIVLIDLNTLNEKLTANEIQLINGILKVDPRQYGFSVNI